MLRELLLLLALLDVFFARMVAGYILVLTLVLLL
jgi:hypothetical protein